jgi:glycosyltransferase involved in cell wall biosynthesis
MMRIFLNGLAATAGAGLTYLHNVIPLLSGWPDVRTTLTVQPNLRHHFETLPQIDLVSPPTRLRTARRFWFEQTKLPSLIRSSGSEVLISAGNFAVRNSPVPQILLSGNSLYTSRAFYRDLRSRRAYRLLIDNFVKGVFARRSVGWADRTVAPSRAFAAELERWTGIDVRVVYHGFDPATFFAGKTPPPEPVERELKKTEGCLRLLFVSHYNYYRNFETLLRALPLVQSRLPEKRVKLILSCRLEAGKNPGAYDPGLAAALIRQLGMSEHVVLLGTVPYQTLHHLYRGCDIYVTASYAETFAHPIVEAMASGLPVVASDIPVHREICGSAASYFDAFDFESLAQTIVTTASLDEAARSRTIAAGAGRAMEFSWSKHVEQLLQIAWGIRRTNHSPGFEGSSANRPGLSPPAADWPGNVVS